MAGGGSGIGALTYNVTDAGTAGCSVGLSSGELTYTSAGTCGVTATKASDSDYAVASSIEITFSIDQATPTISISNSPAAFDGNSQAASISGSVAGTIATILYDGSSTVPTNA